MESKKTRPYASATRKKQSEETRTRIVDAAIELLREKRYEGMTMQSIAERAGVATPTVYAAFRSKAGILAQLMERVSFGSEYVDLVRKSQQSDSPDEKLRIAAQISRHIYDSESETTTLLSGVSLVRPELGSAMDELECRRYDGQKQVVYFIDEKGALKDGLDATKARALLWSLTSRDLYVNLVRRRGWSSQEYEEWLGGILVYSLLGAVWVSGG